MLCCLCFFTAFPLNFPFTLMCAMTGLSLSKKNVSISWCQCPGPLLCYPLMPRLITSILSLRPAQWPLTQEAVRTLISDPVRNFPWQPIWTLVSCHHGDRGSFQGFRGGGGEGVVAVALWMDARHTKDSSWGKLICWVSRTPSLSVFPLRLSCAVSIVQPFPNVTSAFASKRQVVVSNHAIMLLYQPQQSELKFFFPQLQTDKAASFMEYE